MSRTKVSLLVTVVAALALVLGSVATASAGTLTARTVKKIATQVAKKQVAKQGTKLTVANSNLLGGQPASAFQSPTYVVTSTITVPIHDAQVPISLPAGHYLIGYSVHMGGAATKDADCDLEIGSTDFGESNTHTDGTPTLSGFGYVDTTTGAPLKLHCSSTALWATGTDQPIQVVATRVDLTQSTTAAAVTS